MQKTSVLCIPADPERRERCSFSGRVDRDGDYAIFLLHIQYAQSLAILHKMGQVENALQFSFSLFRACSVGACLNRGEGKTAGSVADSVMCFGKGARCIFSMIN